MWCSDPFLNYLKSFGYCVVLLPRANVKPLQVLSRQGGSLDQLGELTTLLVVGNTIPVPSLNENIRVAQISGQRTSDLSIGIGISILGNILSAMGGSRLGIDTQYRQAKTLVFEFHDVLRDEIELLKLDQYLTNADVSPFSHHAANLLVADQLYVTTATIKSNKFTVEAKRSNGTSLELKIPEIQEIVGSNVKVSGQTSTTSSLTYEGSTPLVFGFQAVQLFYNQGHYSRFELVRSGTSMREGSLFSNSMRQLESEGPFLRLNSE